MRKENSMKVKELMTKQVATVKASEPQIIALRTMWESDCGSLPVMDDEGRVVGVITDRDIAMALCFRDASPSSLLVSEAMSKELHSCSPGDSLDAAEKIMRTNQIRRLPVLDGDHRLVGLLSTADLACKAARSGDGLSKSVTAVFSDICSPRADEAAAMRT